MPGHPRLFGCTEVKNVDARHKAGHERRPLIRYRVAPRWAPASGTGAAARTGTFQISSAYSRMVRSEENHGIRATLRIAARVQAGTTCQRASMPRWAA